MLGYQKSVKGYRLWCIVPGKHKILLSRDVVFLEEKMPFLEQKFKSKHSSSADLVDTHFEVEEVASGSRSVDRNEIMDPNDESDDDSATEQVDQD